MAPPPWSPAAHTPRGVLAAQRKGRTMYHLAQVNIGRVLAPLDDPLMDGFVSRLDGINAIADASPGFVWRLQGESGNATDVRVYEDERILINMSVWESLEALTAFVYASA